MRMTSPEKTASRLSRLVQANGLVLPLTDRPIGPICAAATKNPNQTLHTEPMTPTRAMASNPRLRGPLVHHRHANRLTEGAR